MVQQGAFPFVQYPIVPGHEIAGAVEEIGYGVTDFISGRSCGLIRAVFLLRVLPAMPERRRKLVSCLGLDRNDGQRRLAEFVIAKAAYVTLLPPELDYAEAAPLVCAGITVYSGLKHSGYKKGDKVAGRLGGTRPPWGTLCTRHGCAGCCAFFNGGKRVGGMSSWC
jgi:NADPH:quinone reductase-like Zn-dependent oxidoreductase